MAVRSEENRIEYLYSDEIGDPGELTKVGNMSIVLYKSIEGLRLKKPTDGTYYSSYTIDFVTLTTSEIRHRESKLMRRMFITPLEFYEIEGDRDVFGVAIAYHSYELNTATLIIETSRGFFRREVSILSLLSSNIIPELRKSKLMNGIKDQRWFLDFQQITQFRDGTSLFDETTRAMSEILTVGIGSTISEVFIGSSVDDYLNLAGIQEISDSVFYEFKNVKEKGTLVCNLGADTNLRLMEWLFSLPYTKMYFILSDADCLANSRFVDLPYRRAVNDTILFVPKGNWEMLIKYLVAPIFSRITIRLVNADDIDPYALDRLPYRNIHIFFSSDRTLNLQLIGRDRESQIQSLETTLYTDYTLDFLSKNVHARKDLVQKIEAEFNG